MGTGEQGPGVGEGCEGGQGRADSHFARKENYVRVKGFDT